MTDKENSENEKDKMKGKVDNGRRKKRTKRVSEHYNETWIYRDRKRNSEKDTENDNRQKKQEF